MRKYRLTKIAIKEGFTSSVRAGRNTQGRLLRMFLTEDDFDYVEDCEIDDIIIDDEVAVNYTNPIGFLKTSPITSITRKSPTELEFETTTSIYSLIEVFDGE